MLINNVDVKNLDILFNVIRELAVKLSSVGYHKGQLEFNSSDTTAAMYLIENWEEIKKGSYKKLVATKYEVENDDNYHFASESLFITSTVLNSGNLLIELSQDVMAESGSFKEAEGNRILKVYLIQLS